MEGGVHGEAASGGDSGELVTASELFRKRHLAVFRFLRRLAGREELAEELTEYGARLQGGYQERPEPPFDDFYADHRVYLRALREVEVDEAVAHFRRKIDGGECGGIDVPFHRQAIAKHLSRALGKEVVPHFHVNPAILGGLIVRVGDTVLDGSVRRRLAVPRGSPRARRTSPWRARWRAPTRPTGRACPAPGWPAG